jgi:hypothetical protein
VVGRDAVQLLGHRPVEAAQPRLEVRDAEALLRRDERRRQRGVHVAGDEHEVRPRRLRQRALEREHDARGLLGVRAGADAEVDVGTRQGEVLEEHVAHLRAVVLAGVHEALGRAARRERPHHRRHLHEVRARSDDVDDEGHARNVRRRRGGAGPNGGGSSGEASSCRIRVR